MAHIVINICITNSILWQMFFFFFIWINHVAEPWRSYKCNMFKWQEQHWRVLINQLTDNSIDSLAGLIWLIHWRFNRLIHSTVGHSGRMFSTHWWRCLEKKESLWGLRSHQDGRTEEVWWPAVCCERRHDGHSTFPRPPHFFTHWSVFCWKPPFTEFGDIRRSRLSRLELRASYSLFWMFWALIWGRSSCWSWCCCCSSGVFAELARGFVSDCFDAFSDWEDKVTTGLPVSNGEFEVFGLLFEPRELSLDMKS